MAGDAPPSLWVMPGGEGQGGLKMVNEESTLSSVCTQPGVSDIFWRARAVWLDQASAIMSSSCIFYKWRD